jgi:hypothetical protein
MAKDTKDKITVDLLAGVGRGGARRGAGRKPGKQPPRKPVPWRVSEEALNAITTAAEKAGHKPGDVLDWIMLNHKRVPEIFD